jgi:putative ABC transport system permease protein
MVHLALKSIAGRPFRSGLVFLCVALVAGSAVWGTLVVQGARENLRLSLAGSEQAGADIIVIPRARGAYSAINTDLGGLVKSIAAVAGVAAASPQQHLFTLVDSPYCAEPELAVVAFDPATDFTVLTALASALQGSLDRDEAIAGSLVSAPSGDQAIALGNHKLKLAGHMLPSGSSLDYSLLVSFETADAMARSPRVEGSLDLTAQNSPIILVSVARERDPGEVAAQILREVPGVTAFDSADFFELGRARMASLLRGIPSLLAIGWGLSVAFMGAAFSIAANERRREIGVLRALGSPRSRIWQLLVAEALMVAFGGGVVGVTLSSLAGTLLSDTIGSWLDLPLVSLTPVALLALIVCGLLLALASGFLAVLPPAWRFSRLEPAAAMRE